MELVYEQMNREGSFKYDWQNEAMKQRMAKGLYNIWYSLVDFQHFLGGFSSFTENLYHIGIYHSKCGVLCVWRD